MVLVFPRVAGNVALRVPPFGLLMIASRLRRAGFKTEIIDLNVENEERLCRVLRDVSRRVIYTGFSVFTGPMIREALRISAKLKALFPRMMLVWGGPHPAIMPELTARHPLVDVVCIGEGERTAVNLARDIARGDGFASTKGIAYQRDGEIVINGPEQKIPIDGADRELSLDLQSIDLEKYIFINRGKRTVVFLTSRGCPYRCSFCWNLMFHKRRYLAWSPAKVREEMEPLRRKKVERIIIFDSFVGPVDRVEAIGDIFRRWDIEWAIEDGCRVDYHNSREFFRMLEEKGCTHVAFGAESGSQRILDDIHKDISVEDIVRSAENRLGTRVASRYQWMTGIPGEEKEDSLKTVRLIDRVSRINPLSAHCVELYLPYPGNELFDTARAMGWKAPENLEGWGEYRWQGRYPYHREGTWFFKSLQYSNFFRQQLSLSQVSAFTANVKPVFKAAMLMLMPFAYARWHMRRFEFPVEYQLAEMLRRLLER